MTDSIANKMKMSLMLLLLMVVVGVSLMRGSHALKCYKCNYIGMPVSTAGIPCMDPTLKMETCEAKKYCATIGWMCGGGTIHSLILSNNNNNNEKICIART